MPTDATEPTESSTDRSFTVHHQAVFAGGGTGPDSDQDEQNTVDVEGLLALDDTPFETTLFDHGVDGDTRTSPSRIETGGSNEFIDDRPVSAIDARLGNDDIGIDGSGHQGTLFADTAIDQRTLDGEQANARFMFDKQRRRGESEDRDY
jgi:hypothetical protein